MFGFKAFKILNLVKLNLSFRASDISATNEDVFTKTCNKYKAVFNKQVNWVLNQITLVY